jgi:hypothetical protein
MRKFVAYEAERGAYGTQRNKYVLIGKELLNGRVSRVRRLLLLWCIGR